MNETRRAYLTIGEFAELTRLSQKALRIYHEQGLLRPAHVDRYSGYRYYDRSQITRARMIRMLRQMDMPLAGVQEVLALVETAPADAATLVDAHVRRLQAQVRGVEATAAQFLAQIETEDLSMSFTPVPTELPEQGIVSLTRRTLVPELDKTIRESLETLRRYVAEQQGELAGAPLGIYHGCIDEQEDGPIEVCLPAQGPFNPAGEVVVRALPGGPAVVVDIHEADCEFPAILGAYDAAADWISQQGHEPAEPPREVWLSRPGEPAHMQVVWRYR